MPKGPVQAVAPAPSERCSAALSIATADAALVARIRAGDTAAFEQLFEAYYSLLCNFALPYVESPDAAEDLVQEVLLWLWEERARLDVRSELRAYLYVAIRNRALNHLRSHRVASRWAAHAEHDLPLAGAGQGPPSAERAMRHNEVMAALHTALAQLPERRRMAFVLAWQHGLTNAETARIMGISVKGVEAALAKALDSLREVLAPVR
jgi:RNA polymerase sigma-70 factor (ECF subfamily)